MDISFRFTYSPGDITYCDDKFMSSTLKPQCPDLYEYAHVVISC